MAVTPPDPAAAEPVVVFGVDPSGNVVAVPIGAGGGLALDLPTGAATQATLALALAALVSLVATQAAAGADVPAGIVQVGGKDSLGDLRAICVSAAGIAQTQPAKGTSSTSTAAEASRVISAGPCLVSKLSMLSVSASARHVQSFNATSLPANGAVAADGRSTPLAARSEMVYNIPTDRYSLGCVLAISSSPGTLTIAAPEGYFTGDLFASNA